MNWRRRCACCWMGGELQNATMGAGITSHQISFPLLQIVCWLPPPIHDPHCKAQDTQLCPPSPASSTHNPPTPTNLYLGPNCMWGGGEKKSEEIVTKMTYLNRRKTRINQSSSCCWCTLDFLCRILSAPPGRLYRLNRLASWGLFVPEPLDVVY